MGDIQSGDSLAAILDYNAHFLVFLGSRSFVCTWLAFFFFSPFLVCFGFSLPDRLREKERGSARLSSICQTSLQFKRVRINVLVFLCWIFCDFNQFVFFFLSLCCRLRRASVELQL